MVEYFGRTVKRATCVHCSGEIELIEWDDGLPAEWVHPTGHKYCPTIRVAAPKQGTIQDTA